MTDWTTLSQEELKCYLAPGQLDMILEQLPHYDLDNPIPMVLESIVERIRFELHSSSCIPLHSDANTLPSFFKIPAYHLALESLASLLPGVELSTQQKQQAKNAREFLSRITSKKGNAQNATALRMHHTKKRNNLTFKDFKGL